MRTKTPKQIHDQARRILLAIAQRPENYETTPDGKLLYVGNKNPRIWHWMHVVNGLCRRYVDNIYRANNVNPYGDTETSNNIYYNAHTPASVYAQKPK